MRVISHTHSHSEFLYPASLQVAVMFSLEYFRKRGIGIETGVNALLVRHINSKRN